jgi:hypothetical protein
MDTCWVDESKLEIVMLDTPRVPDASGPIDCTVCPTSSIDPTNGRLGSTISTKAALIAAAIFGALMLATTARLSKPAADSMSLLESFMLFLPIVRCSSKSPKTGEGPWVFLCSVTVFQSSVTWDAPSLSAHPSPNDVQCPEGRGDKAETAWLGDAGGAGQAHVKGEMQIFSVSKVA